VVVYISGCWDLFHVGHLNVLKQTKELGDILVAGVSTEEFVKQLGKPLSIIPFIQRYEIIKGLQCVDFVTSHKGFYDFDWIDKFNVTIRAIGPHFGKHKAQRESLEIIGERGIGVIVIPRTLGISSTIIREVCYDEETRRVDSCSCGDSDGEGCLYCSPSGDRRLDLCCYPR